MLLENLELNILSEIVDIEKMSFPNPWDLKIYEALYKKDNNFIFVIIENNILEAYAVISDMYDSFELLKIAVRKESRNKGYGIKIIREIIGFSEKDIFLEVRKSNEAAKRLYEREGFIQVGFRKGYYPDNNEDALVFKYEKAV